MKKTLHHASLTWRGARSLRAMKVLFLVYLVRSNLIERMMQSSSLTNDATSRRSKRNPRRTFAVLERSKTKLTLMSFA